MNTHAIFLFDGSTILITEPVAKAIMEEISNKEDTIFVNGQLINVKNISRIGYHANSADMIRRNNEEEKRALPEDEQKKLEEMKFKKASLVAQKRAKQLEQGGHDQIKELTGDVVNYLKEKNTEEKLKPPKDDEPMYYIENGEKMYS